MKLDGFLLRVRRSLNWTFDWLYEVRWR